MSPKNQKANYGPPRATCLTSGNRKGHIVLYLIKQDSHNSFISTDYDYKNKIVRNTSNSLDTHVVTLQYLLFLFSRARALLDSVGNDDGHVWSFTSSSNVLLFYYYLDTGTLCRHLVQNGRSTYHSSRLVSGTIWSYSQQYFIKIQIDGVHLYVATSIRS
jgi:hypothetical protein